MKHPISEIAFTATVKAAQEKRGITHLLRQDGTAE